MVTNVKRLSAAFLRADCAGNRAVVRLAWHASQCVDRSAVRLAVASGQRRYRGRRDRCPVHRQDRRLALATPCSTPTCCGSCRTADVRDIVFDVDFSTPSDPASDQEFVEALRERRRIGGLAVLQAAGRTDAAMKRLHINRPLKQFGDHSWTAVVNVAVEPDGLVRRYPFGEKLDGKFLPSMAAVLAGQYAAEARAVPDRFQYPRASIPRVSYVDVLRGDDATLAKLQRQEGHHRRHRARTRRSLQRSERRGCFRARSADACRRIDPAEPRAAAGPRISSRWPGYASSR